MNKRLYVLSAILLGSVSSTAMAQQLTGPYLTSGIGGAFALPSQSTGPSPQASTSLTYNPGLAGTIALGYEFGNGFRAELQYEGTANNVSSANHGGLTASGHTVSYDFFGNAIYDYYGFGLPIVPHVGVGLGELLVRTAGVSTPGAAIDGHSSVLGYQGIVGAEYPIMPNLKLGLDYRFIGSQDTDVAETYAGTSTNAHYKTYSHNLFLTLRVEFGTPPVPPLAPLPAVVPPPPPPAPVAKAPEIQRAFQVFFDFNKSDITAAAAKVIQQAADSVKAGHMTKITVTGHTDTVGSAKYNQALSERRAAAVKAKLIADGVSTAEITTIGVGKTGLLVPTADGVREPQNRRAEIVLQ